MPEVMPNRIPLNVFRDGAVGQTDGQLLEAFITRRDEAAFETLVRRHGPMVLSTCRRILGNYPDAEDAFQAAFLVLVRKAASVRPREMVGGWLYGVAYRAALKARTAAARRRAREQTMRNLPEPRTLEKSLGEDLLPLLDQELHRLPEKLRLPVVLCDLEGKTRKEAALQLGWPEGTVAGRLAQARALLARRLTRQGLPVSAGVLATLLSQNAGAAVVPPALVCSTVRLAWKALAGEAVLGAAPVIAQGVVRSLLLARLKALAASLLFAGLLAGACISAFRPKPTPPPDGPQGLAVKPARAGGKQRPDRQAVRREAEAGIQAGVEFVPAARHVYQMGDTVTFAIRVRNVGAAPRKVSWFTTFPVGPVVEGARGKAPLLPPGRVVYDPAERVVAAGEEIELGRTQLTLTSAAVAPPQAGPPVPAVAVTPGKYAVYFPDVAWQGEFPNKVLVSTPELNLEVQDVPEAMRKDGYRFRVDPDLPGQPVVEIHGEVRPIKAEYLAWIASLPRLRVLDLGLIRKLDDADLAHLRRMKSLAVLGLGGTNVGDAGVARLKGLTGLKSLTLCFTRVTDRCLPDLRGMNGLERLILSDTQITDAGLALLRFAKLRTLQLGGADSPVTDAGLKHVARLTTLNTLWIAGTRRVTDAGLKELAALTDLRELVVDDTGITEDGLRHLAGMKKLASLSLSGIALGERGAKRLATLSSLHTLTLQKCRLTDDNLALLGALGGLKCLYLDRNEALTLEALRRLQRRLPDLRIFYPKWDDQLRPKKGPNVKAVSINQIMRRAHLTPQDRGTRNSLDSRAIDNRATAAELQQLLALYRELALAKPPRGGLKAWRARTGELVAAVEAVIAGEDGARPRLARANDCTSCHALHRAPYEIPEKKRYPFPQKQGLVPRELDRGKASLPAEVVPVLPEARQVEVFTLDPDVRADRDGPATFAGKWKTLSRCVIRSPENRAALVGAVVDAVREGSSEPPAGFRPAYGLRARNGTTQVEMAFDFRSGVVRFRSGEGWADFRAAAFLEGYFQLLFEK
jgi:RNA polymerase sigma factor (sigma-70 family)